ncbi:MAG TPA: DUF1592 domain-containing protein, partial [Planctomycetaceae bacterium]|nr:DUF1592 domain-containing protein [Planctomycetaceae bacterium]
TTISAEWDQATTQAALEVAGKIDASLRDLANLDRDSSKHEQQLKDFCTQFVERAFRRPLSDEQRSVYIDRQFAEATDARTAVKRVVILTLKSPRFLFPGAADGQFDDHRTAAWLALALWDSIPDRELREVAAKGELSSREQIAAQTERMLADDRAKSKLKLFFQQWLSFDRLHEFEKARELYPDFNEQIAADLRVSLDLFLDDVVWSDRSDFRNLLLSNEIYLNGRLAKYYGYDLPEDAPFQKVALEPDVRAGLLTHPYLMAGYAYTDSSSPIHRGVFLTRNVLGRFLKPPPIAVAPTPVDLAPDMTTRERVTIQTRETLCMSCHGMINDLGFSLEQFDAVGRFRKQERGRDVDASGRYVKRSGEEVRFEGARELA